MIAAPTSTTWPRWAHPIWAWTSKYNNKTTTHSSSSVHPAKARPQVSRLSPWEATQRIRNSARTLPSVLPAAIITRGLSKGRLWTILFQRTPGRSWITWSSRGSRSSRGRLRGSRSQSRWLLVALGLVSWLKRSILSIRNSNIWLAQSRCKIVGRSVW